MSRHNLTHTPWSTVSLSPLSVWSAFYHMARVLLAQCFIPRLALATLAKVHVSLHYYTKWSRACLYKPTWGQSFCVEGMNYKHTYQERNVGQFAAIVYATRLYWHSVDGYYSNYCAYQLVSVLSFRTSLYASCSAFSFFLRLTDIFSLDNLRGLLVCRAS